MPNQTSSKRISISLNPELHNVISDLSQLQNKPMSRVVVELLDELTPLLSNVRDGLVQVQKTNDPKALLRHMGNGLVLEGLELLGDLSKEIKEL
jgi:hypothetical protein